MATPRWLGEGTERKNGILLKRRYEKDMKRTIAVVALLGMLSATPALADIVYTPQDVTLDFGDIGLYDPANPDSINTVMVDPAEFSDTFQFVFAMRMRGASWWLNNLHFSFAYDNSSLDVIGATPLGGWDYHNYGAYVWPASGTGDIVATSLRQGMSSSGTIFFGPDVVVPFLQVTLHVNSAQFSALNDFGVVDMVAQSSMMTVSHGDFDYYGGTIHEIPEPATATLLIGGLAALMGGVVRRRRQA